MVQEGQPLSDDYYRTPASQLALPLLITIIAAIYRLLAVYVGRQGPV